MIHKIDASKPFDDLMKLNHLDLSDIPYDKVKMEEARKELHILEGVTRAQKELIGHLFDISVLSEALRSSEIEGIHTTPLEVLAYDVLSDRVNSSDEEKVSNYKKTIIDLMLNKDSYLPLSHRSFKKLHNNILPSELSDFRPDNRKIVNHKTKEVRYTPPSFPLIPEFITDLENFMNNDQIDILLKIPITHYQFESIHPFKDGNGRTGRLLILLQLLDDGILTYPIVHISKFINKDKAWYSDILLQTTQENKWDELINYFTEAIIESVKSTTEIILQLKDHIKELEEGVRVNLPSGSDPSKIANFLIKHPVTNIKLFSENVEVARDTAKKYLQLLEQGGILIHQNIGKSSVYGDMKTLEILQS